jgi:hypothetical protein
MLLRLMKGRFVVLPLATFLLLFAGGAAVAPECHIEVTSHAHAVSATPHTHGAQALDYEMCFAIGFVAFLIFRFLRLKRSTPLLIRVFQLKIHLPHIRNINLSFLNLTHLQLGIIRV